MSKHCKECHGGNGHTHSHEHSHSHGGGHENGWRNYSLEIASAALLAASLVVQHTVNFPGGNEGVHRNWWFFAIYAVSLLPVGLPVIREMLMSWRHGSVMNEFTLMVAASAGAFIIGEYPEAVAVLLFYSFGEKLEDSASDDVRRRIKSLLGRIPDRATVIDPTGARHIVSPESLPVGTRILVMPGERVPIDARYEGKEAADFDTAAITGESVPRAFNPGDDLPSGIIPVDTPIEAVTTRPFNDSSMTRILRMIEDAQAGKSHTETMLRRITRWYTPVVFALALAIFVIPWCWYALGGHGDFVWADWFKRSLVFLVCSCPCALVVSIPLSYFVSLGTASRLGLLFKGSRYLDGMRKLRMVVFDKTGTLTTGSFHIEAIRPAPGISPEEVVAAVAAVDADSSHPLAKAVCGYAREHGIKMSEAKDVKTVRHGITGVADGKRILAGSEKLMAANQIAIPAGDASGSRICVAADGRYIGSVYLVDTIKNEARSVFDALHKEGVKVMILSGDRAPAVRRVAESLGADGWKAELLPEDKQRIVKELHDKEPVAFVGDGINDAPAIAASDVGVAMGTMGTGMAMDTADVIISGDNLRLIERGIRLSKRVRLTVIENVSFALGVKALVMTLGACGIATLWAAVFADTGVTLITILWTLLMLRRNL